MGVSSCSCIIIGIVEIQAVCLWACQPLICSQSSMCQNQTAVDVLQQTPSSSLTSTTGVRRTANSQSCLHMAASQTDRERLAHKVNVRRTTNYGWMLYWEDWSSHWKIGLLKLCCLIYVACNWMCIINFEVKKRWNVSAVAAEDRSCFSSAHVNTSRNAQRHKQSRTALNRAYYEIYAKYILFILYYYIICFYYIIYTVILYLYII